MRLLLAGNFGISGGTEGFSVPPEILELPSEVKALEKRMRELEGVLGKKNLQNESLRRGQSRA
jgi:hypothetical protein